MNPNNNNTNSPWDGNMDINNNAFLWDLFDPPDLSNAAFADMGYRNNLHQGTVHAACNNPYARPDTQLDLTDYGPNHDFGPVRPISQLTQQQQPLPPLDTGLVGTGIPDELPSTIPHSTTSRRSRRVPIQRASRSRSSNTITPTGPMTSTVTLPPRPRPGRKPMEPSEQQDKRRMQNRMAQRNFRDKRQQKLSDTLNELAENKEKYEEEMRQEALRREDMRTQLERAHRRINELEASNRELEGAVRALSGPGNGTSLSSIPSNPGQQYQTRSQRPRGVTVPGVSTPGLTPSDQFSETDFTTYRGRTQPSSSAMRPSLSTQTSHTGYGSMDIQQNEMHCGFCTDSGNCLCKKDDSAEPSFAAGNCDACINNPARRAACREIAQRAGDPSGTILTPMMSCSSFLDKVEQSGDRLPSVSQVVDRGQLHVYSSGTSGFEVQEQEAAQALQELARK